ncbi:MAG TPA: LysM domain-containing protein [Steroidobacteraceae bacterium]|nr:LysM domain-containing protein [Steroidobacteraceae bacterium]
MVSNQVLGARFGAGLVALSLTLSGCGHFPFRHSGSAAAQGAAAAPAAGTTAEAAATAPAPDMTATEAAIAAGAEAPAPAPAAAPASVPANIVNPSAPKSYVVKKGDTLWSIASMFLKDPWLWPEVWIINPRVPNPHLIYPGDTLELAYGGKGSPQITVVEAGAARLDSVKLDPRLRSSALDQAIPTIPYSAIQAFLAHPRLLTRDQIRTAPYVLAFRDTHQVGGSGIEVYVANLSAEQNSRYAVMRVGDELRDPDDNALLGYEGVYTATALVERAGNPAKALLTESALETVAGDRLVTANDEASPVNFTLRAPSSDVHGRIIAVVGGTDLIGQFEVVAINRGKSHGLVAGNVLAVDSAGDTVRDLYRGGRSISTMGAGIGSSFAPKVKLPDERIGTALVFRVYDRMSYALILGASDTIHVRDVVRNP